MRNPGNRHAGSAWKKAVRASLAFYNTHAEVDSLGEALHRLKNLMKTISPTELKHLIETDPAVTLLDVRTPAEYGGGHVAEARNEPLDSLDPLALASSGTLPADKPVYILCQTGGRATKAAEKFAKAGLDRGVVIEGGTAAWKSAGFPVTAPTGHGISIERQVRIGAGLLGLTGSLLAIFVHPYFIAVPTFIGAGLTFAGITDWCGMGLLLARMPWNK